MPRQSGQWSEEASEAPVRSDSYSHCTGAIRLCQASSSSFSSAARRAASRSWSCQAQGHSQMLPLAPAASLIASGQCWWAPVRQNSHGRPPTTSSLATGLLVLEGLTYEGCRKADHVLRMPGCLYVLFPYLAAVPLTRRHSQLWYSWRTGRLQKFHQASRRSSSVSSPSSWKPLLMSWCLSWRVVISVIRTAYRTERYAVNNFAYSFMSLSRLSRMSSPIVSSNSLPICRQPGRGSQSLTPLECVLANNSTRGGA